MYGLDELNVVQIPTPTAIKFNSKCVLEFGYFVVKLYESKPSLETYC